MLTLTRQARVRRTTPRARHQQRHRPAGQARKRPRLPPRAHGEHGVHATIRLAVLLGGACGRCIIDSDRFRSLHSNVDGQLEIYELLLVSRIATLPAPASSATGRAAAQQVLSPAQHRLPECRLLIASESAHLSRVTMPGQSHAGLQSRSPHPLRAPVLKARPTAPHTRRLSKCLQELFSRVS